jgi:hypothetical protein
MSVSYSYRIKSLLPPDLASRMLGNRHHVYPSRVLQLMMACSS